MEARDTTPAEQRLLDMVAERESTGYAEEHKELILLRAEMVGELTRDDRPEPTATDSGAR